MIATAHYRHPTTGETATVVIYRLPGMDSAVAKTYIGATVRPTWEERFAIEHGDTQHADADARVRGNIYHRWLTHDKHMRRVA